jgi:hypothetical protein
MISLKLVNIAIQIYFLKKHFFEEKRNCRHHFGIKNDPNNELFKNLG